MNEGILFWNESAGRPDIAYYEEGSSYGGLRCGNTLEALICGRWTPTRVEYRHSTESWYLVGLECDAIYGLSVRN